jgi:hypothetical protein
MKEFKPKSWAAEAQDLATEYNEWDAKENGPEALQTKPEELSLSQVRRGVLDVNTGEYGKGVGMSKQMHIIRFTPSERFQSEYERIFGHV